MMKRLLFSLLVLVSLGASAQFPSTGSIQFPTSNGVGYRGTGGDSLLWIPSDTLRPASSLNGRRHIAIISGVSYYWNGTKWAVLSGGGGSTDTTSLSNRINLKLNISDTAAMLTNYVNGVGYALLKSGQVVRADSATLANYFLRRKDSASASNLNGYLTRTNVSSYAPLFGVGDSRATGSRSFSLGGNDFLYDSVGTRIRHFGYNDPLFGWYGYNGSGQRTSILENTGAGFTVNNWDRSTGESAELSMLPTRYNVSIFHSTGNFYLHNSKESGWMDQIIQNEWTGAGGGTAKFGEFRSVTGQTASDHFFTVMDNNIGTSLYNQILLDSTNRISIGTKNSPSATYKGIKVDGSHQVYVDSMATGGAAADSVVVITSTGQLKKRDASGIGTGTVISVATNNGSGITGGTITTSGTIAADTTSVLSTKANVLSQLTGYTPTSRTINVTAPVTGGGSLTADRTIGLDTSSGKWRSEGYNDTKYAFQGRLVSTGYGLSGGGSLAADRTHIVDSATLSNYYLRRKDSLTSTNLLGYVTRTVLADTAAAIRAATGGGTPTWQQTLTAGSTLTGNNSIAGGAFNFTFGNMGIFTISQNAKSSVSGANGTSNVSPLTVTGGNGGATSFSTGTVTGGSAGGVNITAGNGGAITGTPATGIGGTGGTILLTAGDGGLGTTNGGTAGNVELVGGTGGNGTAGGTAGYVALKGGMAGSTGNAAGGDIYISPGAKNGSGLDGHIFLGVSPSATVRGSATIGSATRGDSLFNIISGGLYADRGVRFPNTPSFADTTNYKPVVMNSAGTLYKATYWPGGGSGSGEVNTASNIGGGLGIFNSKVGVDLQFKSLKAADFDTASNLISIDYTNGQSASGSNKGFLTSTDWTTFNSKTSISGTPSANQMAVWTNSTTIKGSTNTYDDGASFGVGTTTFTDPITSTSKFQVVDGTMTLSFRDHSTGQGWLAVNSSTNGITGFIGHTNTADGFVMGAYTAHSVNIRTSNNNRITILSGGNVGIGVASPTSRLHLPAGTATANSAPLKFNSGTALTTPEDGAIEYHSSHLYFTIGSTRYQLDQQTSPGSGQTFSQVMATTLMRIF